MLLITSVFFESVRIWAFASCKLTVRVVLGSQLQKLLQHLTQKRHTKFDRNISKNFGGKNTHWNTDTSVQLIVYDEMGQAGSGVNTQLVR
jgi:hypothetical protein